MEKNIKIYEKFLYEIWKDQQFENELVTRDGDKINVLDTGQQNRELGGPDFKNVRIKIGNITYNGDVEIDSNYSDWKNHGHNLNKRYNSVILHASLNNDSGHSFVYTQEGRKVLSLPLGDFLERDIRTRIQDAILKERKNRINKMPCVEINDVMDKKKKIDFIFELGILRFKKKRAKIIERLKELKYLRELNLKEPVIKYELDENFYSRKFTFDDFKDADIWKQLFYEQVFEALGYSNNKAEFFKLATYAELSFIKKFSDQQNFFLFIEAILFHAAGITPGSDSFEDEETLEYLKKLKECRVQIQTEYDCKILNAEDWHFYKHRPANFPTLRIAGGAEIIYRMIKEDLVAKVINVFHASNNYKKINKELRTHIIVKSKGYWKKYYNFGQQIRIDTKYFIGLSRADEIIVNVILPFSSVYFEMFGKKELAKKVLALYVNYFQNCENNLVQEVSSTLLLNNASKRSILYQGMIELFRCYCSKAKCMECVIGKSVFN